MWLQCIDLCYMIQLVKSSSIFKYRKSYSRLTKPILHKGKPSHLYGSQAVLRFITPSKKFVCLPVSVHYNVVRKLIIPNLDYRMMSRLLIESHSACSYYT